MNYKALSDKMKSNYDKTFLNIKNKPKFSFIMRLVKLVGEDEVERQLGHIREMKSPNHIKHWEPYLMSIVKPLILTHKKT